jgi:hypothetical protein
MFISDDEVTIRVASTFMEHNHRLMVMYIQCNIFVYM